MSGSKTKTKITVRKYGEKIKYNFSPKYSYEKDETTNKFVSDAGQKSECAMWVEAVRKKSSKYSSAKSGLCIEDDEMSKIIKAYDSQSFEMVKQKTQCDSERCVVEVAIDDGVLPQEAFGVFKLSGPTDSTLLSNVDIDESLKQWQQMDSTFFAYNFNMRDYRQFSFKNGRVLNQPDTLSTVSLIEKAKEGFRTFGCVINLDKYSGGGTHWMALFADIRDANPDNWTAEFFNSSGQNPVAEFRQWLAKAAMELGTLAKMMKRGTGEMVIPTSTDVNASIKTIIVTDVVHQYSKTECGVYSLYYIWARLNGVSYTYFKSYPVPDEFMYEFRRHLFHDERQSTIAASANSDNDSQNSDDDLFDWDEFRDKHNLKWESY